MQRSNARTSSSSEKPTQDRFFKALVLAVSISQPVLAQEPASLSEVEVVRRALSRPQLSEAIEGELAIERGRAQSARAHPNPELAYLREQTFGSAGTGEDNLSVEQAIDLGGMRGLRGEAGELRVQAARAQGDATRVAVAAEARLRFYDLLYRQGRAAALEAWTARIASALVIVARREERGDATTYDRRRLERERAVAEGHVALERAGLDRARARLLALIGPEIQQLTAAGKLLPEADPQWLAELQTASGQRPDLRALDLYVAAAERERDAASRGWVPELRLLGGWKGVDLAGQGRSDGFMFGASLVLPLWDRGAGLERAAGGEARVVRARRAQLGLELTATLAGARAEAVRLRGAALEFQERMQAVSSDLVRIAIAGYEGGELGLLEWLDAERGAAEDGLTALEMAYAARRARLELDRMTAMGLP